MIDTVCPGCGAPDLLVAGADGGRRVCEWCGSCWEWAGDAVCQVDPTTCAGCPQRMICESRPTWLAEERTTVHELADGTRVLVRPLLYSDRLDLNLGFEALSDEDRRLRFLSSPAHLSLGQLEYLTNLDYDDHFAWSAFALEEPGQPGIGVARYVRDSADPTVAEAAVTVDEAHRGRGVGTLLLWLLASEARGHGITRFVAHVLWENDTMLSAMREIEARITPEEPGVARVEVDLPPPDVEIRESRIYHALRVVAALLSRAARHGRVAVD